MQYYIGFFQPTPMKLNMNKKLIIGFTNVINGSFDKL